MVDLKPPRVRRFRQRPGECSVASSATIGNYYDRRINYELVSEIARNDGSGLTTPEIGKLLNNIGFGNVTIVSADLYQLDFQWKDLAHADLVRRIRHAAKTHTSRSYRKAANSYVEFLTDNASCNELIIDRHFGTYIRKYVGQEHMPIIATFNWNLFFEQPKWDARNRPDPVRGEYDEHAVVIYACDKNGVSIVDSHHECYNGALSRFQNGRYKMDWETLMQVMGFGDLLIPGDYQATLFEEDELVQEH